MEKLQGWVERGGTQVAIVGPQGPQGPQGPPGVGGDDSSLVTFIQAGSGAVERTVQDRLRDTVHAADFGGADFGIKVANAIVSLPSTGGIVDATQLTGTQSCGVNPFAGVAKPVTLLLGAATISTSVAWTLSKPKQHIHALGMQTVLKASAAMTHVLKLDGSGLANGLQDNVISQVRLDGNGLTTDGLTILKASGFLIDRVSVTNVTNAGFRALANPPGSAVTGLFIQPVVSSNVEDFTTTPNVGLQFDDTGSSNNTIINSRFEGLHTSAGDGIGILDNGQANVYIGGTSEGNKSGIKVGTGGHHRFEGLFLEQNTVYDLYIEGFLGDYSAMLCASTVANATRIAAAAYLNKFRGGSYNSIVIDAGAIVNTFTDVTAIVSFIDNGTTTTRRDVRDNSGPVSPDNINANPYRNLTVYSSSDPLPTLLTVQAHASAQGVARVLEVRDAAGVLRSAFAAAGYLETTRIDGLDGTLGPRFATGVTTLPAGSLVIGSSLENGLLTMVTTDGLVTGTLRATTNASGQVIVGSDTDHPFLIIVNGAEVARWQGVDSHGKLTLIPMAYGGLGSGNQDNGTIAYCSDCTMTNPCNNGGTGALAKRLNGVWVCN